MDTALQALAGHLSQTMSPTPAERRAGEEALRKFEQQPGFSQLVLTLIQTEAVPAPIRQAGAVAFKNYVKYRWKREEDDGAAADAWVIGEQDRAVVKSQIVGLMLSTPPAIQKQLSEALSIVSQYDFPDKWDTLLPDLVAKLNTQDLATINGILTTANSIFKRYRYESAGSSAAGGLVKELKYVLERFQAPLLQLFGMTAQRALGGGNDAKTAAALFDNLRLMARVYYSLCYQVLPEFFEDHLNEWMGAFDAVLGHENAALESDDDEQPGILDRTQAAVCDNLNLFMEKYEEEFKPYLQKFVSDVWTLLMKKGPEPKNDLMVTSAIRFLTTVAKSVHYELFNDPATLKSICEKIQDEELFEENPQEYLRRDIEGSDTDTRRRAACELVKGLCVRFEAPVTEVCTGYITAMLAEYGADPKGKWQAKDAAIYLLLALAVKTSTVKAGTTSTNALVPVADFFASHVAGELQSAEGHPVLKADAIKFVTAFRSQLPREAAVPVLGMLVNLLKARPYVVHTYAANAIERMLTVKDAGVLRLDRKALQPAIEPLLTNLFAALSLPGSAENDYVMKAIMRVTGVVQEDLKPVLPAIIQQLTAILGSVCANPRNPIFNHYLFETVASLVRFICTADPAQVPVFEGMLMPPFSSVLQMDVSEFTPYVFQVLAQLLELYAGPVSPAFMALFPPCLTPALWERPANVPALTRLLEAYLAKAGDQVAAGKQLEPLLGVFQKLVASKANEHEGFRLLEAAVASLPLATLGPYLQTVMQILFTRLQANKTAKFIRHLLVALSCIAARYGPGTLLEKVDGIQPRLFAMLLEQVWIPNMTKLASGGERKTVAVGSTKLLAEAPAMLADPAYAALWGKLLAGTVGLLEQAEEAGNTGDEDDYPDLESAPSSAAAFSQLHFAPRPEIDVAGAAGEPKAFLATSVAALSRAHPGKLGPMAQAALPPEAQAALARYLAAAGAAIA
eukprot:tig00021428_g21154.t1